MGGPWVLGHEYFNNYWNFLEISQRYFEKTLRLGHENFKNRETFLKFIKGILGGPWVLGHENFNS